MTTSSGKPPIDEQGHNARWVPASDSAPAQPDGDAAEPPTQRQRAHSSDAAAEDEEGPAYGALVPYGGDDRTEEIDPVALDAPFTLEQQKTPPAPAAHAQTPRAPAFVPREARDDELKAPVTQLVLSDLFDSVPSSAALAPPDPAAFTSSRPPAPERAPERAPAAAVPAVVALPSIDIGAAAPPARSPSRPPQHTPAPADDEPRRRMPTLESLGTGRSSSEAREPSPKPPLSLGSSPAPGRSSPTASPPRGSSPAASPARASSPAVSPAWGSSPAASPARASSPAASPARASSPTASPARASSPPASPSQPSSPSAAASSPAAAPEPAAPATAAPAGPSPAAPAELDAVARFPSDVATSRPPDVMPIPAAAGFGPSRERAPLATVAAPITVQGARAQEQLPSIMLAADVEAEPDSSARRALRAARATVRIELPASFARPGSPLQPNAPSAPVAYAPPPSYPPAAAYAGPEVIDGALLGQARTRRLLGFALAALALLLMLFVALRPRTGSLVVTALGPGNRAVDNVTIFIDGKPLCDVSPCRIKGLPPGVHSLRASAPGLASQAEESVEISAGDEATYNLDLLAVAPEVRSGGLRMAAAAVPLTLYLDGKRVGRLPMEISGLPGGKHWLKLDPEDGSPPIEKSVNIVAGETVDVDPQPAQREKALVTIRLGPGSEGAAITFDDAFLLDFPAELELEPGSVHSLSASKPGFEDLTLEVKIGTGETEKLIEVSLDPLDGNTPPRKSRPKATRKAAAKAPASTAPAQLADPTQGLLNISSVPPSQIILNGRPLGTTPKTGIAVPGDSLQTIVFVHSKMGRRRAQKFVPAGKERTVSIRF